MAPVFEAQNKKIIQLHPQPTHKLKAKKEPICPAIFCLVSSSNKIALVLRSEIYIIMESVFTALFSDNC